MLKVLFVKVCCITYDTAQFLYVLVII
uniref:Uncharacterized protein n=1 Tax=Rhizophora mucronata TaxID=61149 RepID=A0A2P2QEV4_RHIMU